MKYFAMLRGEQCGPYTLEELAAAGVRPDTYVWCKGMPEWKEASEVADICRYFRQYLGNLMHPAQSAAETGNPHAASEEEQSGEATDRMPVKWRRIIEESGPIPEQPAEEQPDYSKPPHAPLAEAIIATVLCCPIVGIVAIVQAVRCARLWKAGKAEEAYEASRSAKMWTGITFFMGFLVYAMLGRHLLA